MSFGIGLQRDKRRAKAPYDQLLAYQPFHTRDYTDTINPSEQFNNNPALRQYDIANRNRNNLSLTLNLYPHPAVVIGLYHTLNRERYTEELLGVDGQRQRVTTLDVSYTSHSDFTLFGYLTREWLNFAIDGRAFHARGGPGTKEATANDPDNNWRIDNRDTLHTVGAGTRFLLLRGDLTINIKAFYSREKNALGLTTAANLTAEPMPGDYASRRGVEIEGDYYINRLLDIRLGLAYESFRDREWSRDLISPGSDASEELITLMTAEPDYTAYIVYTALRFKW
ncbi:MAG: MtrB/PioB family outer membrane beta-barrel protein [Gammaproteobacteria bacterium]|nr:MtrB/PioB family outer membrane beta-barrel protein [Gammaproteobacteria bacterium]